MVINSRSFLRAMVLVLPLAGCGRNQEMAAPAPVEPSATSIAYFCGMDVFDHPGPKGQIFLKGQAEPVWFSSVRDAIAFTLLPETPKDIAAIYVNDMAKAKDWAHPEAGTWVEARGASYVVRSDFRAGMGESGIVSFSSKEVAEKYAATHGGNVVGFAGIHEHDVLGNDDGSARPGESVEHPAGASAIETRLDGTTL